MTNCAFCSPRVAELTLWESGRYRVIADEHPRSVGHVLLLSKTHLRSHMRAPVDHLSEFEAAQTVMHRFLLDMFGRASFWENGGGSLQEVSHAHLHGMPVDIRLEEGAEEAGHVRRVAGWADVRRETAGEEQYCYLEGPSIRALVLEVHPVLAAVRRQVAEQVGANINGETGGLTRGGADMVERTRSLWRAWSRRHATAHQSQD